MPRWIIHHSPNTLTDEEKQAIAEGITNIYTRVGLPAFYVHLHFHQMSATETFIGGQSNPKFVDFTVYHTARSFQSEEQKQRFLSAVDKVLNPILEDKGADWEYFFTEAPRELWKINGMVPPEPGSEGEKEWQRLNQPSRL